MRIGGLVKFSAQDYPGRLSCVIFTHSCNFHCPYCHNPNLVRPFGELIGEDDVLAFLRERARLLDGAVVSGGEPTIQPGILDFLRMVKALGYRLKLDTNGSRPETLKEILDLRLADYVAMDIKADPRGYPPELAPISETAGIMESVELLKSSPVPHEFRTTAASPFVSDSVIKAIADAVGGNQTLWIQPLSLRHKVLNPGFMALHPSQPGPEDLKRFTALASRNSLTSYVR